MSPYLKAALFVIRLAAFGLILVSALLLAPDGFRLMTNQRAELGGFRLLLSSVPLLVGLLIWMKSYRLAKFFTRDLDD
jgi:hypothetical protein